MSDEKTNLQREILLTWYENPDATNAEIARACDCSDSYVSQVTNRFDDYDEFEAMFDRQDRELERMFGEDVFAGQSAGLQGGTSRQAGTVPQQGPSLAEAWDELPDNPVGNAIRVMILVLVLFVCYKILQSLVPLV